MTDGQTVTAACGYRWCRMLARSHYENFPVASWLLPAKLRDPVATIYAFSRVADDIADEGNYTAGQRLERLHAMESALSSTLQGAPPEEPLYQALADTFRRHALPASPLYDLLHAFRDDITRKRFSTYEDVMTYCRHSANPVGRLLLHLDRQDSEFNLQLSDAVCSALQWINFLQDAGQDYRENNRIYIPMEDMQKFGVSEEDLGSQRNSPQVRALWSFQIRRTAELMRSGSELGSRLSGRLGIEVRAVILSGNRILDKLANQASVFARPRLGTADRLGIAWSALRASVF